MRNAATATLLISLILLNFTQFSTNVLGSQAVTANVSWLTPDHTEARVIVTINGNSKEYHVKTSSSGQVGTGPLSIISINTRTEEIMIGDSYASQVSISDPPYPSPFAWILRSTPAIFIHLSPWALLTLDVGLVIAIVAVGVMGVAPFGSPAILNVRLGAMLNILTLDHADHNSNQSLDLWVPTDWFNTAQAIFSQRIYIASPHFRSIISDTPLYLPQEIAIR